MCSPIAFHQLLPQSCRGNECERQSRLCVLDDVSPGLLNYMSFEVLGFMALTELAVVFLASGCFCIGVGFVCSGRAVASASEVFSKSVDGGLVSDVGNRG